jgi:hypothetical protein
MHLGFSRLSNFPLKGKEKTPLWEKERTNGKQWHPKGLKLSDLDSKKQFALHFSKLLGYANINTIKVTPKWNAPTWYRLDTQAQANKGKERPWNITKSMSSPHKASVWNSTMLLVTNQA